MNEDGSLLFWPRPFMYYYLYHTPLSGRIKRPGWRPRHKAGQDRTLSAGQSESTGAFFFRLRDSEDKAIFIEREKPPFLRYPCETNGIALQLHSHIPIPIRIPQS